MPKAFDKCAKTGGKIRTVAPKKGTYIHVCYKGGKSYSGHVKHTKSSSRKTLRI